MAAQQAYVHPPDNPLLAPLNQLGTSIDTNYTNSWTLREIIRTNAQYILDQLARIQQSVTDMQDQFVANRNMVVQLQNTIYDLQDQLAAALAAGQAVQALQQQIADLKVKQTPQRIETQLWQATTGGTDCFDGFKTLIATGQTGIANSSGVTFSSTAAYGTSGNPITEVDKLINVLDDNAMSRDDLRCFMSYANFRLYVQALTRANFFQNYIGSTDITGMMEATHPNTNVKVIPTIGLNGSNQVTIGPAEYMVVGFDLLSDSEKLVIWYSKDFDELRLRANYNYGAQIAKFGSTAYFATNNLA